MAKRSALSRSFTMFGWRVREPSKFAYLHQVTDRQGEPLTDSDAHLRRTGRDAGATRFSPRLPPIWPSRSAKVVGFVITGSSSMASEAVHSFADSGNEVLLLFGSKRATRPADEDHPFGYASEHYFWAFLVSVVLFTLGALFSLAEGVNKLRHPGPIDHPAVALTILLVALVLEAMSFRKCVHEANRVRNMLSWPEFIRRSKNPDLTVVLLEDIAALVGLSIAICGVALSITTEVPAFDAIASLLIGVVLAAVAAVMGTEMKSLLLGEAASSEDRTLIASAITSLSDFGRIIHMRTDQLGPDEILVAVKVAVAPLTPAGSMPRSIDEAERRIRRVVPAARYVFIEVDVDRSGPDPS